MKLAKDFSTSISSFVNEVRTDALGNIIAHKHGSGKRIMLIAHQDVVSLMITHIDDNGFLYIKSAGGIDISLLPARKVVILHGENSITGIIGKKPIHLMKDDQIGKISLDNLWIDIGAKSKAEAKDLVSIGDYAYFCSEFENLPNDLITGSYFDDQVGLNVLMRVAEQIATEAVPWDIYFVASNYEEIGMRGATVAAQSIQPDVCICIDVTHATDYPTMNVISDGDIKLGDGCVLAKGPNIYSNLFSSLEKTALLHQIKYQIEVCPYPTGTDANVIQLSGQGVKTAVVSIPCRYMHTPYEVCSTKDIECAIHILYEFICEANFDYGN